MKSLSPEVFVAKSTEERCHLKKITYFRKIFSILSEILYKNITVFTKPLNVSDFFFVMWTILEEHECIMKRFIMKTSPLERKCLHKSWCSLKHSPNSFICWEHYIDSSVRVLFMWAPGLVSNPLGECLSVGNQQCTLWVLFQGLFWMGGNTLQMQSS